jgi:hypothetical protein
VVLGGAGSFVLGGRRVPVETVQMFVTPPSIIHAVSAGDIVLVAIFVPALA